MGPYMTIVRPARSPSVSFARAGMPLAGCTLAEWVNYARTTGPRGLRGKGVLSTPNMEKSAFAPE